MCFYLDDPAIAARFWAKVEKTDSCWLWTGATSGFGYGRFKVKGKLYSPHMLTYAWDRRDDPKGFDVCHHCNNPRCVNPEHLFKGSRSLNMIDAARKNRIYTQPSEEKARGEKIATAKLTEEKVRLIKKLLENGDRVTYIAKDFGVDEGAIRQIRDGKTWKHVK